jgi:hypothetical protein
MNPNITVIESQLDWLTLAVHSSQKREQLRDSAYRFAKNEAKDGNSTKPFRLKGYSGWRIGRFRYGEREGAALIQLSGQLAEDHLATLLPLADSVTRLDLAVTVHDPLNYDRRPRQHFDEMFHVKLSKPQSAIGHYHEDTDGGSSLQIGDRESDRVLRVYNKFAEQLAVHDGEGANHYVSCVRYELELKGENSERVAAALSQDAARAATVQATVHTYCTDHGLDPAFPSTGAQAIRTGFRRRSDYDSRIRWYARSVAPSIAVALQQGEACEVLDALGLAHLLQPTVFPLIDG